jgi:hypothetical protein
VTGSGQGQRVDTCWGWSRAGQRIDEAEAGTEDAGGAEAGTEDVDRKALGRRQTAWAGARMATDSSGQRDDGGRAEGSGSGCATGGDVVGSGALGGGFGSKILGSGRREVKQRALKGKTSVAVYLSVMPDIFIG